jgi:hypothetical protein
MFLVEVLGGGSNCFFLEDLREDELSGVCEERWGDVMIDFSSEREPRDLLDFFTDLRDSFSGGEVTASCNGRMGSSSSF